MQLEEQVKSNSMQLEEKDESNSMQFEEQDTSDTEPEQDSEDHKRSGTKRKRKQTTHFPGIVPTFTVEASHGMTMSEICDLPEPFSHREAITGVDDANQTNMHVY